MSVKSNGAVLITSSDRPIAPAVACAVECAKAWSEVLTLEPIDPNNPTRPANDRLWVVVAIDFRQLVNALDSVSRFVPKDAILIGYVFDAFFSRRLDRLPGPAKRVAGLVRKLRRFSAIYSPVKSLIEQQVYNYEIELRYMPIGVDAMQFGAGGMVGERFVDINGYGRQPPALIAALSDHFNRQRAGFLHFTSHVQIGKLLDPSRHREHFWQLLRNSRIALAYAPEAYDPQARFPCSFVGQRWFESMAAGCVVAGRRPHAHETNELLCWPDSTIELPEEPEAALESLLKLGANLDRLEAISHRNYINCLQRHDWRLRARQIAADFPSQFHQFGERIAKVEVAIEERLAQTF